MTLSELGEQYKNDLKTLDSQIKRLKKELKSEKSKFKKSEIAYKIIILKDMYRETSSLSNHLIKYYEDK